MNASNFTNNQSISEPENYGQEILLPIGENTLARIEQLIQENPIMIFIKGTPTAPRCGFSANVINILNQLGKNFSTYDILKDMPLREGLKEFSNWPTYPQVYVNGKFIGGNDIITEMMEKGEMQNIWNSLSI